MVAIARTITIHKIQYKREAAAATATHLTICSTYIYAGFGRVVSIVCIEQYIYSDDTHARNWKWAHSHNEDTFAKAKANFFYLFLFYSFSGAASAVEKLRFNRNGNNFLRITFFFSRFVSLLLSLCKGKAIDSDIMVLYGLYGACRLPPFISFSGAWTRRKTVYCEMK